MSIHSDKAFALARSKGAAAGHDRSQWACLSAMSKRELVEIALHLAAQSGGAYDDALANGDAYARVIEERDALRANGLI